jgi:hypothetical protein
MTLEKVEERKISKAAKVIQAAWRGARERNMKQNVCLKTIAQQLLVARRNFDSTQTLAAKLKVLILFLRYIK